MRKCPLCGVPVKLENVERHVGRLHPGEKVDLSSLLSKEEARESAEVQRPMKRRVGGKSVVLVAVVGIIIVAILAVWTLVPPSSVGPSTGTDVGQLAPDFTLQTTDGTYLSISSLRGKPVLLAFVDLDGGPCQEECNVIASVYADFSTTVHFLSIDVDMIPPEDDVSKVNDFRATRSTPWPYALDPERTATNLYGISTRPAVFILDEQGVIRHKFIGRAQDGYAGYATALNDVLQG